MGRGRKQLRLGYNTKKNCSAHVQITRIVLIPIQWIAPYLYLVNLVWKTTEIFMPFCDAAALKSRTSVRPSHPRHSRRRRRVVLTVLQHPRNACWNRISRIFQPGREGEATHLPTQEWVHSINFFPVGWSCQHQSSLCLLERQNIYSPTPASRRAASQCHLLLEKNSICQFQVHTLFGNIN